MEYICSVFDEIFIINPDKTIIRKDICTPMFTVALVLLLQMNGKRRNGKEWNEILLSHKKE